MADLKISQLPSLAEANIAATDELAIVDTSASETKKVTAKALVEKGVALIDAGSIPGTALASLGTNSVVTASITDANVTNAKLANSSISLGGLTLALGSTDATPALNLTDATNYPTSSLTGTITNAQLAGSIANDKLANSSISLGGVSISLGGTNATPALNLTSATNYPTSSLTGTITNAQLAGSIANAKLANSSINIGGVTFNLGDTDTSPALDLSDATSYPAASLTGTITNAQLAGSIQGSKIVGGSITSSQLGTNSVTAVELADNAVDSGAIASSAVTDVKVASGISGAKISDGTISAAKLATANIDRSLNVASGSLGINNVVSAATRSGITYNAQGLITGSVALAASDLPISSASAVGGVSVGTGLSVTGAGALSLSNSVTGATVSGITFNNNGMITAATGLVASDLPTATTSAKGAVQITSGGGLTVDGSGGLTTSTSGVGAGTYQSVVVNTKGVITSGTGLTASLIPDLAASKITSGSFDAARIGASTISGAKLANSSVCVFSGATSTTGVVQFPAGGGEFTGQFFYDLTNDDLYVYDGNAWQPVTITSGEIIFSGTYNASNNQITSLSAAGTAQGFSVGSALAAASAANNRYYFVCDTSGTGTSPAPTEQINPPDMILSNGSAWEKLDISGFIAGQASSNISVIPNSGSGGGIHNTNVQAVLEELDTEKLNKAGGTISGQLLLGNAATLVFEGATADAYELTLAVADPQNSDKTLTLPDITGTLISNADTGTVTSTMLANGTIVNADINASAAIALTKLENVTSAQIIVGNGSNVPTAVAVTGDIGITNAGLTSISAGVIVNADVSATAAIAGSKITTGTTSAVGVLQLTNSAASSSTTTAATPAAVKVAKDAADAAATTANAALPTTGGTLTNNLIIDNAKQIRFTEADANGANYVSLQAPDTLAADTSYTLPSAFPTANGQVLASTTGGVLSWTEDPTGGWVTSGDNISYSAGDVTFTGASYNLVWDKSDSALEFADNAKATFGTGDDLQIYHSGSHGFIKNTDGTLYIDATTNAVLRTAASENSIKAHANGNVELYYDNSKKFQTTSIGCGVTGNLTFADNGKAIFGAGNDLQIYHDGSNSYIKDAGTGDLYIRAGDDNAIRVQTNASVDLYYDNSKKLETTSWGTDVIGILRADELQLTGDNQKLYFGAGPDLQIYHNGSHSFITTTTGNLALQAASHIQLKPGNGEDGIEAIANGPANLFYDNSKKFETTTYGNFFTGSLRTDDGGNIKLGTGSDLQIYHDGSHNYLDVTSGGTGNLYMSANGSKSIYIRSGNGSSGVNQAVTCLNSGAVELYYDDSKKFETSAAGVVITGVTASDPTTTIYHSNADVIGEAIRFGRTDLPTIRYHSIKAEHSGGASSNMMQFHIHNASDTTSQTEVLELTGDGRVHVNDNIKFECGTGNDLQIWHDGGNSYLHNNTGRLRFESDNYGFGFFKGSGAETLAFFNLDAECSLYYDNSKKLETTSGGITVTGSVTETSDVSLKNDINTIQNPLELIEQIRGINFTWKNNGMKSMGVIAQDVEKVFPELVHGTEGSKTLQYSGLIGALVESVKELSAKVAALEAG